LGNTSNSRKRRRKEVYVGGGKDHFVKGFARVAPILKEVRNEKDRGGPSWWGGGIGSEILIGRKPLYRNSEVKRTEEKEKNLASKKDRIPLPEVLEKSLLWSQRIKLEENSKHMKGKKGR